MTYRSRLGCFASTRKPGWRRVAASLLVPLIAVLTLPMEEPLAAIAVGPPASIAPPQLSADRTGGAAFSVPDVGPLRFFQERAPPSPSL